MGTLQVDRRGLRKNISEISPIGKATILAHANFIAGDLGQILTLKALLRRKATCLAR